MSHVLRFLQGFDLRNPTRTLDIIGPVTATTRIGLASNSFGPGPGKANVQWSGQNPRRDGQRPTGSSRDNIELPLKLVLSGESQTDIDVLQRKINSFLRDCQLFEEDAQGEPVWMFILFGEAGGLEELRTPVMGQFGRYLRLLRGDPTGWPETTWRTIVGGKVDGFELALVCEPFYYGLPEQAWSAVGDITIQPDGVCVGDGESDNWLRRTLTTELSADFTIIGWAKFQIAGISDQTILHYYVDANNQLLLIYDLSEDEFNLTLTVGGDSITCTLSEPDPQAGSGNFHFWISYLYTTGELRLTANNGTADDATDGDLGALPADGILALGSTATGDGDATGFALDGWRIFDFVLGDTEESNIRTTIYNAELPVRENLTLDPDDPDVNARWIGPPVYWLTTAGDDVLTNPGFGVLGGVGGDVDALVKWHVTQDGEDPTLDTIWLARKASVDVIDPMDTFYLDISIEDFSEDVGVFGGGVSDDDLYRGEVQILCTYKTTPEDVTLYAYLNLGGIEYRADDVLASAGSDVLLYDLGDIFLNWPEGVSIEGALGVKVLATADTATSMTIGFILAMPYPLGRAIPVGEGPFSGEGGVYITQDDAYMTSFLYPFDVRGDVPTAEPNKYNYIILLVGSELGEVDTETTWQVTATVTPRWLLPGGLVG